MSDSFCTRQERLFIESFEDALEATAIACGGKKSFACAMRPEMAEDPDAAGRWLKAALDTERREVLHAIHLVRGLKEARRHHCHILKHWLDEHVGYQKSDIAAPKSRWQAIAEKKLRIAQMEKDLADEEAALRLEEETAGRLREVK